MGCSIADGRGLCNHNMQVGHTTPVGQYPKNVSPYGALDLAGNIGEWTSSLYKPFPAREGS